MSEPGDARQPERAAVPNLHLHQLAYLRQVAHEGSLSRAADALHVSQPALSQALAELERRLGVALFERDGRGRRATAAGREVTRFAEEVLVLADSLVQRLDAYRDGHGGPLNVGMIDAGSLYVLPEVVGRFREAYPGVDLKLTVATSGDLLQRLRAFALDLAFVVGPVNEPDLDATEVLREPLYLYRPAAATEDLRDARWVLYPEGSRTRGFIDAAFARVGLRPLVTLESSNPQVLRQMVTLGLGWSVLPAAIAETDMPSDVISRGELLAERPLFVVRRRTSPADPRAEAFLRLALGPQEEARPRPSSTP